MSSSWRPMVFKAGPKWLLLAIMLAALVVLAWRALPPSVGTSDFIGYWAGARLLLYGQNPYDADNILQVQQEAQPTRTHPMFTWNPPWLGVLLLPLGALPFPLATTVWLVLNLLLIGASSLGIWRLFDGAESVSRLWLALPVAFLFPQTITTLDTGQINTFVLVGITGFLVASKGRQWFLAGASLALTTIKPHLVFLWLPLVFLWTLGQRRWQVWLGFGLTLALWLIALGWYRPSWLADYVTIFQAPLMRWATPTLGGLMAEMWGINWGRYLGLGLLPLVLPLWWKTRHNSLEQVTAWLLPVSLILAAFGWSYDQILLLFPLIAVAVSLVRRELSARDACLVLGLWGVFTIALFGQRLRATNEVFYFWVPWVVLAMGAWTAWRRAVQRKLVSQGGASVAPTL